MIFREMPPVWDPAFRPIFYARWGRESSIVSADTRRVAYGDYRQLLSIKAAFGGSEDYFVDGRRITVDDDTFLILNNDRLYASRVESQWPIHSFSIFFERGLIERVRDSMLGPGRGLLDVAPGAPRANIEFAERLHEHDRCVTPVLKHIQAGVDSGVTDPVWLEEQLMFLLGRMLKLHHNRHAFEMSIPSVKPATRHELMRRLGLAVNFIHSNYRRPLELGDMARAAHLSPFHFLRTFKSVYGMSPSEFLNRKRTRAAARLMPEISWTMEEVAAYVGFGSRTTLFRHLREANIPAAGVIKGPQSI
jgi:AraC-like DNA-binding protein